MLKHFQFLALVLLSSGIAAQTSLELSPQAKNKLMETKFREQFQRHTELAKELAAKTNMPLLRKDSAGNRIAFDRIAENGQLIYNKTFNIGAGRTTSTNKVWPGGTAGTALTGSNMSNRLGEWDGGAVLVTHQEFGGRVVQVDGATDLSDHATHVAGTMVAAGIDANAKGMAYQAALKAHDWNFDESEMVTAANAGMLLSNHSYGTICGWEFNQNNNRWEWWGDPSISTTEDYKFGYYDQQASDWDDIAFNNPNYLICKSAGNDRGDNVSGGSQHYVRDGFGNWVVSNTSRPADGGSFGYDCIASAGTAKNILTVGAVAKINNSNTNNGYVNTASVVMSSFSGWGPTDDGRIKPDVVGCGVDMYSTGTASNTAYLAGYSGTSMASPNVTGSLLLVQQHYQNERKKFMRAATLKALAIHTADEAGSAEGPDYIHGWGLLNTAKAVKLISDSNFNLIQERTLASSGTYSQGFSSDGLNPIKFTICWTDPAGTPVAPAIDPINRMLVNDLDIRITRNSDNQVFSPYVLNPASPAAAATKGDNTRDNVEQIYIAAPTAGSYTLTVSHKGTLTGGSQSYSMILSGIVGKPAAAFTASETIICNGTSVTYTDNSGGNPSLRQWYFPGGNPSTSTAATVNVTYPTNGKFGVALKVSNALGTDSVFKMSFIQVGGMALPLYETFEPTSTTLPMWTVDNPDNDSTWKLETTGGLVTGNTSACLPYFNYSAIGERDGLISPALNFNGFSNTTLSFKHAYTNYTASESDSLVVYISTNCGNTWKRLFGTAENGTNNFRTISAPSTNRFVPSARNQWCANNCITLNLSAYDGMEGIKLKFEGYNAYNNNLYIDSIYVRGTPLKPVASFGAQQTTVCAGKPVSFIDSSTNNPTSWNWTVTGPASFSSTQQFPVFTFNQPGTYSVKLRSTNAGGSDSLTRAGYITVLPAPGIPNIVSMGLNGLCTGDSVQLKTDSVATGYTWLRSGLPISNGNTSQLYAKQAGDYTITVSSLNGCTRTSVALTLSESIKPTTPVITTSLASDSFCQGGSVTLTSSANSSNQWYRNLIPIQGATSKTFAATDSGSYAVKVNNNGCLSDVSNTLRFSIKSKPITSAITGATSATVGNAETYSVQLNSGSTYAWTVNNGTRTPGNGPNEVIVTWANFASGSISVRETASNGCIGDTKTLSVTLSPNTGLPKFDNAFGLVFYPNPVSDKAQLTLKNGSFSQVHLEVINLLGQTVLTDDIKHVNQHILDVAALPPGMYILNATDGQKQVQLRFTKR